jgi:hypothetical protein
MIAGFPKVDAGLILVKGSKHGHTKPSKHKKSNHAPSNHGRTNRGHTRHR